MQHRLELNMFSSVQTSPNSPNSESDSTRSQDELRRFGQDRGLYKTPDDFDEPLPEEVLEGFYDNSDEI